MTTEEYLKIRKEYGIYAFQIPKKEQLEKTTEKELRETFSNMKKLTEKMKNKKE